MPYQALHHHGNNLIAVYIPVVAVDMNMLVVIITHDTKVSLRWCVFVINRVHSIVKRLQDMVTNPHPTLRLTLVITFLA